LTEFVKIFLVLCFIVGAFFVGKNHGLKTYFNSKDYKKILAEKEDLDYAKNEFENAKAKLQNIIDQGDKKKTEELLTQILHVFLTDLGIQIQNRKLLLQQARQNNSNLPPVVVSEPEPIVVSSAEKAILQLKKDEREKNKAIEKLRAVESKLTNTRSRSRSRELLDRVSINNLGQFLSGAEFENSDCLSFIGEFRGDVAAPSKEKMGSMTLVLKPIQENSREFLGKITWYYSPNPPLSSDIQNSCGKKIPNIKGRFFSLTENRIIQLYPVLGEEAVVGNFYEILPAGTSKRIGTVSLRRMGVF
jgi:hypothetical protein